LWGPQAGVVDALADDADVDAAKDPIVVVVRGGAVLAARQDVFEFLKIHARAG
jgi:hypothetical protein